MIQKLSSFRSIKSIIKYELKWDLRKMKIYISLSIVASLSLIVTIYMGNIVHIIDKQDYWLTSLTFLSTSLFLFLMGGPVTMNTISGEFESGSIVPLLSRPVSRTEVFFGKAIASFIIVLFEMILLGVILATVSTIMMGAQSNLYQLGIYILTLATSTFVYASLTMMLSSITKNSTAAILGAFGIMFGIQISLSIYSLVNSAQTWFILLPFIGSDNLTNYTISAFRDPGAQFMIHRATSTSSTFLNLTNLQAALITFAFALIFIAIFLIIGWIVFKKTDIKD